MEPVTESYALQNAIILGLFVLFVVTYPWGMYRILGEIYFWAFPPKVNVDDSLLTQEQKNEIKAVVRRRRIKEVIAMITFVGIMFWLQGDTICQFWSELFK